MASSITSSAYDVVSAAFIAVEPLREKAVGVAKVALEAISLVVAPKVAAISQQVVGGITGTVAAAAGVDAPQEFPLVEIEDN